ncbi:hypothetical protein HWV62_11025 [Athelia sp. TMB]|nr:hypothetical protein HWV62_11025 [Athelia sp. TMB]
MAIELVPLPLPESADPTKFFNFGVEVKGVHPGHLHTEELTELIDILYKHDVLLFRDVDLTPEQQYALVKAFDPASESYGHGNKKDSGIKSILHPHLTAIPRQPQVQLIGHGLVRDHEGLSESHLQHPSHKTFHKTRVSDEDEAKGYTRFYRWHQDAALYGDLAPPKVTALYGIGVPQGPRQTCRYDDGTGEELSVPLGTTAFVSGKNMFEALTPTLKSVAVRSRVKYAPHCFVWMAPAHAHSTGLGMETEGLELPMNELPPWEEAKMQTLPALWKNAVTGNLHVQLSSCGALEVLIDPLPAGASREGAVHPDGAHLTDLNEVRSLLYQLQRPGIAPKDGQVRKFHQCNLAASDFPSGPTAEDIKKWA